MPYIVRYTEPCVDEDNKSEKLPVRIRYYQGFNRWSESLTNACRFETRKRAYEAHRAKNVPTGATTETVEVER